jgi:hypothetical protein
MAEDKKEFVRRLGRFMMLARPETGTRRLRLAKR